VNVPGTPTRDFHSKKSMAEKNDREADPFLATPSPNLATEFHQIAVQQDPQLGLEILELETINGRLSAQSRPRSMTPIEEETEPLAPESAEPTQEFRSPLEPPTIVVRDDASTVHNEEIEPKKRPPLFFSKTAVVLIVIALIILIGIVVTVLLVVVYKVGQTSAPVVASSTPTNTLTQVVANPTPASTSGPVPTTAATRLDRFFSVFSSDRNSRLSYNGETCYMVLFSELAGGERWATPPNPFYNCEMHLRADGNLVMYFGNVTVWQALQQGRPTNRTYSLAVSDAGQAQLRDMSTTEVYWSVP
jgi:hypothetical protein